MTADTKSVVAIYTDGSGINGHIGAATVSLRYKDEYLVYLGREQDGIVFVAKLKGLSLALEIVAEKVPTARNNRVSHVLYVHIFTDN